MTGGAGFLGSHLCERLLLENLDVICLDDFSTGSPAKVEHLTELGPFRLLRGDVAAYVHIPGPLDYVLHFASPASPADYLHLPPATLGVCSLGTLNTLGLAREKKARYLLASTAGAYGNPQVHPQPEGYPGNVNPVGLRGVYEEASRFAEAVTTAYRRHRGVDTAIARIYSTHGPRMRLSHGAAVPTFIRQALAGEPITVTGDGRQTRSIQYVDDLVEGCFRLLTSGYGDPVNLGNPAEIAVGELARRVLQLAGSDSPITHVARPADDPDVRAPDITLARDLLAWEPRVGLDEGLERTIAWFRETVRH